MNSIRQRVDLVSKLPFTASDGNVDDQDEDPEWERRGTLSKIKKVLTLYPFLTVALLFFVLMLGLYFYPVIPTAHSSPTLLLVGVLLVSHAGWGAMRERAAIRRLEDYHLHISFYGNSIVPRLGKRVETGDDKIWGFKTLREFSWGGLQTAYEEFRDRFARREIGEHINKHSRVDDDGSGAVVDGYLDSQTARASTMRNGIELFDEISVTHVGEQKTELDSKNFESRATLPPTIDARTSANVRVAFESEKEARREAEAIRRMLRDHVEEMEEYVDPSGAPLFENTIALLEKLNEMHETNNETDSGVDLSEYMTEDGQR